MADLPEKKVLKFTPDDNDNDNGEIDRLSALPDCVLLHILSLLDTKHAAATSILSTRWRNLFVWLPDIDFSFLVDDDATDRDRLFSDFINFANRVIQQRNKAPIRKIGLDVKYFVGKYRMALESLLNSVAAATSWSNVQKLDIALPIDKTDERLSVSIPPGIFTSKTLVSLSLSSGVDWIVPNLVCLPNLKFLVLNGFRLIDEDSIRRFLQGCPVLETLILVLSHYASESEEGIEVKVVDISNPLLKNLILYWSKEVESEFTIFVKSKNLKVLSCFLKGQHKVTIDAPNLSSLSIGGHVHEVNIIQNLTSLDNAKVETGFLYYVATESNLFLQSQHALKLFSGLQNVKSFCLSEDILTALCFSQLLLPTFENLIKLELRPSVCPHFPRICISKVLSSLFESSPNLEALIFSEVLKNYFSEGEEFDSVFQEALPITSIEHLKEIEISKFKGEEHEFKLVEFLLKNGKSLKKMSLVRESWKSVSEGCDRILSFKKCSGDCQIVLKKKWDWIKCPQL